MANLKELQNILKETSQTLGLITSEVDGIINDLGKLSIEVAPIIAKIAALDTAALDILRIKKVIQTCEGRIWKVLPYLYSLGLRIYSLSPNTWKKLQNSGGDPFVKKQPAIVGIGLKLYQFARSLIALYKRLREVLTTIKQIKKGFKDLKPVTKIPQAILELISGVQNFVGELTSITQSINGLVRDLQTITNDLAAIH